MNRVKEIRKSLGLTQQELAERLDTTAVSISRYENSERKLTLPILEKLALAMQCSIAQLTGEDDHLGSEYTATNRLLPGFATVPVYDLDASAGPGSYFEVENKIDELAFQENWLRDHTTGALDQLAVLKVKGDSMEDTLRDGDHVLVDRTIDHIVGGAIYVLWWRDTLMVKRIKVNFKDNTVDVISDNPRYAAELGVDPNDLRIAGRVIWLGRKV